MINSNSKKKFLSSLMKGFAITLLAMSISKPAMAAGSGMIFFSPSTVTAAKDSQVTLDIKATSTAFNAAQIDIAYDSSALEYVSYSMANSVFSTTYDFQQTPGSLKITLFSGGNTTIGGENLQLLSYTFRVIGSSGSANLSFISTTALVNGGQRVGSGSNQATITIPAPSTTATTPTTTTTQPSTSTATPAKTSPVGSTQLPSSSTSSSSSGGATVIPPSSDTTAPKILAASPFGFSGGEVSIKVVTDEPTKAMIKFGTKESLTYNVSTSSEAESYTVPLGSITKLFDKETTYTYQVEVTDAAGNKTTSQDYEFVVKPVTLTLKVQDKNGKVLAAQIITVNEKEFTTDNNGIVKVTGVIPGTVSIFYKNGDTKTYIGNLTASKDVANQSFTVTPTKITNTTKSAATQYVLPAAIVIAAFVMGSLLLRKILTASRRHKEERQHFAHSTYSAPDQQASQVSMPQSNASFLANAPSAYAAGQVITPTSASITPEEITETAVFPQNPPVVPPAPAASTAPIVTNQPNVPVDIAPQQPAETQPQQPVEPNPTTSNNPNDRLDPTTKP